METEVLAPAGSKEGLMAALFAGADAVYTGGRMFGARAYADNLSDEELLAGIDYCHLHGKRLYLTVNTLVKEEELSLLIDWLAPFYEAGLDAAIVQDLGAFSLLKKEFPQLELHASTQMTVHGAAGAKLLEKMGAARVVPARELSLAEIQSIRKQTDLEIECFVHGALCYSYSGQCLLSSLIGGRSGNRGRCAQPCRLPYSYDGGREHFLLSPKDICTLEILPDILEAGVDSLKIEGRMKRTEYTAGVSAMYRKYVDRYRKEGRAGYRVEPEDVRILMDLYNRGGFSTGYYKRYHGVSMMSVERQNHYGTEAASFMGQKGAAGTWRALEPLYKGDVLESQTMTEDVPKGKLFSIRMKDRKPLRQGTVWNRTYCAPLMETLKQQYTGKLLQEKINGKLMIFPEKPAILTVALQDSSEGISVAVSGNQVQKAQNQPITAEKVRKQLLRTGNTPYRFEQLDIHLGEDCFLPLVQLNELRREALYELEKEQLLPFRREKKAAAAESLDDRGRAGEKRTADLQLSVSLESLDGLQALVSLPGIARIYLDCKCFEAPWKEEEALQAAELCRENGISCWYIMPAVFRETEGHRYPAPDLKWYGCFDGVLVKNLEEIQYLREIGYKKEMASDYNLYSCSHEAGRVLAEAGCTFTTCPVELRFQELSRRGCSGDELLIYGRLPVMTTVQCLQKTAGHCEKKPGIHVLTDRKGKAFPVKNCCSWCFNVIYNSVPISLHGMAKEVKRLSPASVRLAFTTETVKEIQEITAGFLGEYLYGREAYTPVYEFTRGHYRRGVE